MSRSVDDDQDLILNFQQTVQLFSEGSLVELTFFVEQSVGGHLSLLFCTNHLVGTPVPVGGQNGFAYFGVAGYCVSQSTGTTGSVASFYEALGFDIFEYCGLNCFQVCGNAADGSVSCIILRSQVLQNVNYGGQNDQFAVVIHQSTDGGVKYLFFTDFSDTSLSQAGNTE